MITFYIKRKIKNKKDEVSHPTPINKLKEVDLNLISFTMVY